MTSSTMKPPSDKHIIQFKNVGLTFDGGARLFHNISLSIKQGDFYFLTGVSGAGKSSFLKLIYQGLHPTSGEITVFGHHMPMNSGMLSVMRRKIGIVFQDFRLIPHLNVLDNVSLPLKVRGVDLRKARLQALDLLKWVGLADVTDFFPEELSGGQQQRVAICRAVIGQPKILLADEPTGNVDDGAALKLLHLFEEMNKSGTTIVLATHNRSLAREFRHAEIFLKQGNATLMTAPHHDVRVYERV